MSKNYYVISDWENKGVIEMSDSVVRPDREGYLSGYEVPANARDPEWVKGRLIEPGQWFDNLPDAVTAVKKAGQKKIDALQKKVRKLQETIEAVKVVTL